MLLLVLPVACGEARQPRRLFAPTSTSWPLPGCTQGWAVHVSHSSQTPVPRLLGRQRVNTSSGHRSPREDVNRPARARAVSLFL